MYTTMKDGKKVYIPTDEEDATLTAAAMRDEDNPPLSEAQLARLSPASEVLPAALFATLVAMIDILPALKGEDSFYAALTD